MNYKKDSYKFLLIFVTFIIAAFFTAYTYISFKEKTLIREAYTSLSNDVKKSVNTLIHNKKNATMAIAIPISKDYTLINSFYKRDFNNLDFQSLSNDLKQNTNYQNVWIQIVDKNGFSKYRSWSNKKGDFLLNFREELKQTLEEKKIKKIISVGRYDLSFKAIVPVYKDGEFLGLIEAITKFNSISKSLRKLGFEAVVVANKEQRNRIEIPFSKNFIGDYYISNVDVNQDILNSLSTEKIAKFITIQNYWTTSEYFITNIKIENNAGNIVLFKKIDSIDLKTIKDFKKQAFILLFVGLLILIFIVVTYSYQSHAKNIGKLNRKLIKGLKKLRQQRNKTQLLLDSQLNIIVITNGEEILNANRQLLNFFTDCKNLPDFKDKYTCVCTVFVPYNDDESYILEKDYDGLNWAEFILANPTKHYKAAMYNMNDELRHFKLNVSQNDVDNFIIVTLTDITHDIHTQEKLKEFNVNLERLVAEKTHQLRELNESLEQKVQDEIDKSKKKDRVIFQQNKMASIAQMLHNIAHQWRQPLNAISTSSSAMLLNKELDLLDDKSFKDSCNLIIDKSKYLSNTIDNFRNFFTIDNSLELRNIKDIVNQSLTYISIVLEEKSIDIKLEYHEDLEVALNENEFKQAFLKILDNSIESLEKHTKVEDRVIIIRLKNKKLTIQDSGCGISQEIIDRVFEPYFTTKHQSQGVGLGLYMVQEILAKQMNFKIEIRNEEFIYNNKTQRGLEFVIDLK